MEGPYAAFACPAANEGVIAVTATDDSDNFYSRAHRDALVTATSFSSAILSGLAAASKQSQHNKDPAAFALRLAATAADLGPPARDDILARAEERRERLWEITRRPQMSKSNMRSAPPKKAI